MPCVHSLKSVWASSPLTSPTMMNSGRCARAAFKRSNMSILPFCSFHAASRVLVASQFLWGNGSPGCPQRDNLDIQWDEERDGVHRGGLSARCPPTMIMLFLFSTASQIKAITSAGNVPNRTRSTGKVRGSERNFRIIQRTPRERTTLLYVIWARSPPGVPHRRAGVAGRSGGLLSGRVHGVREFLCFILNVGRNAAEVTVVDEDELIRPVA